MGSQLSSTRASSTPKVTVSAQETNTVSPESQIHQQGMVEVDGWWNGIDNGDLLGVHTLVTTFIFGNPGAPDGLITRTGAGKGLFGEGDFDVRITIIGCRRFRKGNVTAVQELSPGADFPIGGDRYRLAIWFVESLIRCHMHRLPVQVRVMNRMSQKPLPVMLSWNVW